MQWLLTIARVYSVAGVTCEEVRRGLRRRVCVREWRVRGCASEMRVCVRAADARCACVRTHLEGGTADESAVDVGACHQVVDVAVLD
eukprot:5301157-Pleurochrysis_carterae.AAC.1